LPFSALADKAGYVLKTHTVDVAPSATVFDLIAQRVQGREAVSMPYIGVAVWTQPADTRNPIVRAITGPQRSQLVPLPDSKQEVETIAEDLPHPSTILLGADATESRFKKLSSESTDVIHLALHGYADFDYPDSSALNFAPDQGSGEDGLLQVREIRGLQIKARMVTLSACNTGVGPVGQAGVAIKSCISNFIVSKPLRHTEVRDKSLNSVIIYATIYNLVNAFIEAGADTVVSTLWELEGHTTEHLMARFYSKLAVHNRKVEALRTAQLELLDKGLPPYYWASFQIVGDPNGKF
jgi:CHAT domain-containing protein